MIQRHYIYLLLSGSLLLSCGDNKDNNSKDQDPHNPTKTSEVYLEDGASLLYEISGNGLTHPSYLYGTIHMIQAEKFKSGDNLQAKLKASELLVMEIEDITKLSNAISVMDNMYLDSGQISDYVSDSTYQLFLNAMEKEIGLNQSSFEKRYGKMKPFGIFTILAQQGGETPMKSYELYLMDLAYENDLNLAGLETLEDQLGVFNQIEMEDMINYITQSVKGDSNDESELEKLGKVYATGRLDSISNAVLNSDDMLMTTYRDIFLDQRNQNWIPVIEKLCKDKTCFIAVGAAHLPGEIGVIQLLKNRGYEVKAISVQ